MALLDTFKQKVLDLGRSEARAKARPLLTAGESFDRSAAGLDRRTQEGFVLFWLLSDRALFLVAGGPDEDHGYRIPYEAVSEISLDFDDNAEFLPWYVRTAIDPSGPGAVTTLEDVPAPGNPLARPVPRPLDDEERARLARGEMVPLTGFGALPKKFRSALQRRMELAGGTMHVTGAELADSRARLARIRRTGRKGTET
jgi:hypothetical protein